MYNGLPVHDVYMMYIQLHPWRIYFILGYAYMHTGREGLIF